MAIHVGQKLDFGLFDAEIKQDPVGFRDMLVGKMEQQMAEKLASMTLDMFCARFFKGVHPTEVQALFEFLTTDPEIQSKVVAHLAAKRITGEWSGR